MIDEAHELTTNLIFILNILKKYIDDLEKLIICSATMKVDLFKQYFRCESMNIVTTCFNVRV